MRISDLPEARDVSPGDLLMIADGAGGWRQVTISKLLSMWELEFRKEPHMGTYAYEVVVPEKLDKEGDVLREFSQIAHKTGLERRPTREELLLQYSEQIKAALNGDFSQIGDVVVVIGPTVGPFGP